MISSPKRNGKRSVFDVHTTRGGERPSGGFLGRLLGGPNVLNLRQKFRARHPLVWVGICVLVLVVIFFGARDLSSKAEVQDFNPSTCLGTWAGPANAEGSPETTASASVPFSAGNSAVYNASGTEIFCGGFVPNGFATSGVITNVGLTFVWQVGDSPPTSTVVVSTSSIEPVFIPATSTPASSTVVASDTAAVGTTTTVVIATTTDDTSTTIIDTASDTPSSTATSSDAPIATPPPASPEPPAPATDDSTTSAPTSTSLMPLRAFFARLITQAFADDTVDSSTASSTTVAAPPIFADLTPSTSSAPTSSVSTSSNALPAPPPPLPDENFLDVSYSTDGQTWISIGKVSTNNWQAFTITLPVTTWDDLQDLQIRVEGIPTTQDPIPPVYLDGMFVEVHYDVPPVIILPGQDDNASSSMTGGIIQVSPGVTITNPPPVSADAVPAPTITAIDKSDSTVEVTVQYVGNFDDGSPLYLYVYPHGTMAERNGEDANFSFAGTPQEGPSVNAVQVGQNAFDPVSKQAMLTIVEPSPPDDSKIATADMIPGTYDVDIAYFDGVTWHLTSPQSFTWP